MTLYLVFICLYLSFVFNFYLAFKKLITNNYKNNCKNFENASTDLVVGF